MRKKLFSIIEPIGDGNKLSNIYDFIMMATIVISVILSERGARVEVLEREANAKHLRSDPKPTSEARKGSRLEFGWLTNEKVTFPEASQPQSFMDPASGYALALLLVRCAQPAKVRLRLARGMLAPLRSG